MSVTVTMKQLTEMLQSAVFDSVIECPCGHGPLEPDFDTCPECGEKNPLKLAGMI